MKTPMNYKLKYTNEDFQVTEVPLMPQFKLKKPYKVTYIWLQKSGLTTFDALEQLKNFFKLKFEDVANQGLKDEDAITEQIISIKKILNSKSVLAFNKKHTLKNKFSKIKHIIGYGLEPVKERMLHGNSFRIVIRNLENNLADNLLNYLAKNRYHYFINYYDNQRFGMPGGPYNTHLIGKAIVENDWQEAYKQIKMTENILPDIKVKNKNDDSFQAIFKSMNPKKIAFFVSSYNSFLWNIHTSSIIKKSTKSKNYLFENIGRLHLPVGQSFQCPYVCEVKGAEFLVDKFVSQPKMSKRNILVATTIYAHNLEEDEFHKNKKKIVLSFFLPTGSYATMIIKQLFLSFKNK
jgi:tRNA pseudouridine13 synthase